MSTTDSGAFPCSSGVVTENFPEVTRLLSEAVAAGTLPGSALMFGSPGQVYFAKAFGSRAVSKEAGPITTETVFDVGLLTGELVTKNLIMQLIEGGQLELGDRVARYIPAFGVHGKSPITVSHLLEHATGLPAQVPFYEEIRKKSNNVRMGILANQGGKEFVYSTVNRSRLASPIGSKKIRSDLDYIVLGALVEVLTGLTLDRAAQRYIFQPLGLRSTSFVDLTLVKRRGILPITDVIAPTGECSWRKRRLCGEVYDSNAWAMGGVAGHSGLFTTIGEVYQLAGQLPYPVAISSETGCGLWVDPNLNLQVVFLSNGISMPKAEEKQRRLRAALYQTITESFRQL